MINDFATSLIRTYVPLAVGVALTWLATHFGVVLSDTDSQAAAAGAVAVLTAAYYLVARLLEKKWPAAGVLLGRSKAPAYEQKPAA
jgi:hypothetical protein